jgi:hypothetical protein
LRFGAALAMGCALTLGVLWGDAGYANAWRTAAQRLPPASRGFSVGHWGFQWYAGQRGYAPLSPREALRAGDLVVQGRGVHAQTHALAHQALLLDRGVIRVPSPALRVMDLTVGAGFYSDAWGLLPFAVRPGAFEEVSVREVPRWLPALLDEPVEGAVTLDFGTREASFVFLDGWSSPESFEDGSARRTFVWAEGAQSALRLPLPRGVSGVALVAAPDESAGGLLRVAIGAGAEARFELRPGWSRYVAPVEGEVEGGMTTVVLEPAGHRRPGLFGRERRPLSVAVDSLAFSSGDGDGDRSMRGAWPVRTEDDRPGLLVAGASRRLPAGPGQVAGRLVVLGGQADIAAGGFTWSSRGRADCSSDPGCAFALQVPPDGSPAVLRADAAVITELTERSAGLQR